MDNSVLRKMSHVLMLLLQTPQNEWDVQGNPVSYLIDVMTNNGASLHDVLYEADDVEFPLNGSSLKLLVDLKHAKMVIDGNGRMMYQNWLTAIREKLDEQKIEGVTVVIPVVDNA